MGKYNFIKTESILPLPKRLVLDYVAEYGGEPKQVEFLIYPYTVEEKMDLQNRNKEAKKLFDSKDSKDNEKAMELMVELTLTSVFYTLRKEDKDITIEDIKKFPANWLDEISFKPLEFEGVTRQAVEEKQKKEADKIIAQK